MERFAPHLPVLLEETISSLFTDPDGVYLDGTIGYGGHAKALISKLSLKGRLIGIDLDPYALEYTKKVLSKHQKTYSLHNANFREYPNLILDLGVDKLTGILLDLGSSSNQIDSEHRGFSFRSDSILDMRFNPDSGIKAHEYLNNVQEKEISEIIKKYGEEYKHRQIARLIFSAARAGKMNTTMELRNIVAKAVNPKYLNKSLARVFQAIRIVINDELDSLSEALASSIKQLKNGGRIVVISFHSLEDRIVKQFFKKNAQSCLCPKEFPVCRCDHTPVLQVLTKKAIIPQKSERESNPRSRSAKLRVAQRI